MMLPSELGGSDADIAACMKEDMGKRDYRRDLA
jgi:hypothetical protein